MPFRYVKGEDGNPIMPEVSTCLHVAWLVYTHKTNSQGMKDLIKKDADKAVDDLI